MTKSRQVQIKFNIETSAFGEYPVPEITTILDNIKTRLLAQNYIESKWNDIRDTNGNTVGQFKIDI